MDSIKPLGLQFRSKTLFSLLIEGTTSRRRSNSKKAGNKDAKFKIPETKQKARKILNDC